MLLKRCETHCAWALFFIECTVLLTGCGEREFGSGVGRPQLQPRDAHDVQKSELSIREVMASGNEPFIRLYNGGNTTQSLEGLRLEAAGGKTVITTPATLAPGAYAYVDAKELNLVATAGDLVLVGNTPSDDPVHQTVEQVYDYVAWGTEPAMLQSPFGLLAVSQGVADPREFVRVPYPMGENVSLFYEPDHGPSGQSWGCATPSSDPQMDSTRDDDLCTAQQFSGLALQEILVAVDPDDDSWVEIANTTQGTTDERSLNLYGVRICSPPYCAVILAPSASLGAGEKMVVWLARKTAAAGADEEPTSNPMEIETSSYVLDSAKPLFPVGELALVAPGAATIDDAKSVGSYLRFGSNSATSVFAGLAQEAGVWASDAEVAPQVHLSGESLSLNLGETGIDGQHWVLAAPTPGENNLSLTPQSDLWTACSTPAPWRVKPDPRGDIVVSKIDYASQTIQLLNRLPAGEAVIATNVTIGLDGAEFRVNSEHQMDGHSTVDPVATQRLAWGGSSAIIQLSTADADCPRRDVLCWKTDATAIGESGYVAVRQDGVVTQFIQWRPDPFVSNAGSVPTAPDELGEAIDSGLWPGASCAVPSLNDDHPSIALISSAGGSSPADYR